MILCYEDHLASLSSSPILPFQDLFPLLFLSSFFPLRTR